MGTLAAIGLAIKKSGVGTSPTPSSLEGRYWTTPEVIAGIVMDHRGRATRISDGDHWNSHLVQWINRFVITAVTAAVRDPGILHQFQ
jgi:hypothetical protein